jgi:hypothetical protein
MKIKKAGTSHEGRLWVWCKASIPKYSRRQLHFACTITINLLVGMAQLYLINSMGWVIVNSLAVSRYK